MEKLQLNPDDLLVETFPIPNPAPGELVTPTGPTGLPHTCPECPRTRNVLCY